MRVEVFEAWIREVQAAIDVLARSLEAFETERDPDTGRPVSPAMAWIVLRGAVVELQELRGRGFRAPRSGLKRSARA